MEHEVQAPINQPRAVRDMITTLGIGLDSKSNPPAKPEDLEELEKNLGVRLPPSYKEALSTANGATFFQTIELYGSLPSNDAPDITTLTKLMRQKGLPPHLVPVAESVLTVCLDVSRPDPQAPGEYKLAFWNPHSRLVKYLDNTFAQWLEDTTDQFS